MKLFDVCNKNKNKKYLKIEKQKCNSGEKNKSFVAFEKLYFPLQRMKNTQMLNHLKTNKSTLLKQNKKQNVMNVI